VNRSSTRRRPTFSTSKSPTPSWPTSPLTSSSSTPVSVNAHFWTVFCHRLTYGVPFVVEFAEDETDTYQVTLCYDVSVRLSVRLSVTEVD